MKQIWLAALVTLTTAPVALADVSFKITNASTDSLESVAFFGVDAAGQPVEDVVGSASAVAPGTSIDLSLALTECTTVYMQATWGDGTTAEGPVDTCTSPEISFGD